MCRPLLHDGGGSEERVHADNTSFLVGSSETARCDPSHSDKWRCPGWQQCAEPYGDCSESKCCSDEQHGCFKRPFLNFAQVGHTVSALSGRQYAHSDTQRRPNDA